MTDVTAAGGTGPQIQTAVDTVLASGGGTVYIPAGDYTCDQLAIDAYGVGGAVSINLSLLSEDAWLNIIGQYTNRNANITQQNGETVIGPDVILRSSVEVDGSLINNIATFGVVGATSNFETSPLDRHIRISGLTILGYVTSESGSGNFGISAQFVDNMRIDNCTVDSNNGSCINVTYVKGLIDHCRIYQMYHGDIGGQWGYGIGIGGNWLFYQNGLGQPTWVKDVKQIYGKYDWQDLGLEYQVPVLDDYVVKGTGVNFTAGPVYIEDCDFYWCRHPTSSSYYGSYVMRDCNLYGGVGIQQSDQHGGGPSTAANAYATKMTEIYNNYFDGSDTGYGTATYAYMLRGGAMLFCNNSINNIITGVKLGNENYDAGYPGHPEYADNIWIWDNTYNNVTNNLQVDAGKDIDVNDEYYLRAPTLVDDGFIYTQYPYPHPLIGETGDVASTSGVYGFIKGCPEAAKIYNMVPQR